MKPDYLLNGYEKRILNNRKKSNADLYKDTKMFQNTLKKVLSMEFETELDDGTVVDVPLAELMIAKRVAFDMEHPDKIDMKTYSSVLNETRVEQEVVLKGADELFGDIVIKNDEAQ